MAEERAKKAAGDYAAGLIDSGMTIGLGTGSTAKYFIEALAKRVKTENLSIKCTATSIETEKLATNLGLLLIPIEKVTHIDIDVDGADQIDEKKNMIKGGGGALFREKVIAHASQEMIVLIDPTKQVQKLGKIPLPVEIIPFGYLLTISCIKNLGLTGKLRNKEGSPFITDNGNYIFDIDLKEPLQDPLLENAKLLTIPGILETGLFIGYASRVIMGKEDGIVIIS